MNYEVLALNKHWWFKLSPDARRAHLEANPKSEYAKPPYHVRAAHTQAVIKEVAKHHYGKKEPDHQQAAYIHHRHRVRLKNSEVASVRTKMHKGLTSLGFMKHDVETSNHYRHPTSKNVVNFLFAPSKKAGHTDMKILHIHPVEK